MRVIFIEIVMNPEMNYEQKVKLKKSPQNNDSIVYALTKKLKYNASKLAAVRISREELVEILVINDLKVKRKGIFLINTQKNKIDSDMPIKTIKKFFESPKYQVLSQPLVMIFLNENFIAAYPISELLNIKYTKSSIREFAVKEVKHYKSLQKSRKNLTIV
jgi:hypothetical protein